MKARLSNTAAIVVLVSSFLSIPNKECNAQNKFNISTGFGILEMLNVGINYRINEKTQTGIKIGGLPLKNESIFSVSGNYYYHFAGESKLSSRPPWFGKVGISYFRDETEKVIEKYFFTGLRLGREINFTNKIGVRIDAGFDIQVKHFSKEKIPISGGSFNMNIPFIPCFGINLFYSL
jgi:outer membrane protein W